MIQAAFKFCMVLQTNRKSNQKNPALNKSYQFTQKPSLLPFLLPVSIKGKASRHTNFLFQHSYISSLFTLKADAQYSKAKQTRLQDLKRLCKHKTKKFSHKLFFSVSKNILIQKILYADFYLLDTSIENTIWSA